MGVGIAACVAAGWAYVATRPAPEAPHPRQTPAPGEPLAGPSQPPAAAGDVAALSSRAHVADLSGAVDHADVAATIAEDPQAHPARRLFALQQLTETAPDRALAVSRRWVEAELGGRLEAGAVRALGKVLTPDSPERALLLTRLERTADVELITALGEAFDRLGPDTFSPEALRGALARAPAPEARVVAIRALALASGDVLQDLEDRLLHDESPLVRGEALEAFCRLAPSADGRRLALETLRRDPELAGLAARVLGRWRDPELTDTLLEALQQAEPPVDTRALARAMAARPGGGDALRELALSNSRQAGSAAWALTLLEGTGDDLRAILVGGLDEAARVEALWALARAGGLDGVDLAALASDPRHSGLQAETRKIQARAAEGGP